MKISMLISYGNAGKKYNNGISAEILVYNVMFKILQKCTVL